MSVCPSIHTCPFFNDKMSSKPTLAEMYKKNYCKGNYEICARFKVSKILGKKYVPDNLFPNQFNRVKDLINKE
ncbi:hypothetical protein [Tepidibacter thalassicus]|uniref:Methyl-accepting chemotaxis protein n=1 Tax=Tepidibacter thalassicus DSM 15285 TaxID=1123350 RepID=A0A1M5SUE2_9FIRM|nr:hypothetical protein [Tepidibacter thalassicus]SHH42149.1 methyl-accepting chemotaxis protein [Tepidibacter thalassicus DSM 15285]